MRYFEDVRDADSVDAGPLTISAAQLAAYVDLTGERHALHADDGIVPMSLLHARCAGALIDAEGELAVVALRSAHWRCLAPVRVDVPFTITSRVVSADEVTDDVGVVEILRSLHNPDEVLLAKCTLNLALRRRPRG